jgi:hypothetical protein
MQVFCSCFHPTHRFAQRLQLSIFDSDDTGQLTEAQLQDFMRTIAGDLPALDGIEVGWARAGDGGLATITHLGEIVYCVTDNNHLQADFLDAYAAITVRKFLFFHGRVGGMVRVRELLTSPWMQVSTQADQ